MHLNAAVAESLRQYADILEKADDFKESLHSLIRETIKKHKRIIFNGNGYDDNWIKEAVEERHTKWMKLVSMDTAFSDVSNSASKLQIIDF